MADRVKSGRRAVIPMLVLAMLLLLAIAGFAVAGSRFDVLQAGEWLKEIEAIIVAMGPWGVAASIGLMILHSFVPFPAEFLAIANGMVFGPALGIAVTWAGAMLGALLAFALSRALGRPFVDLVVSRRHLAWLDTVTGERAVHWVFLARFVPVIAFNLVNYAAGLTKIPLWTFVWTTALGIIPMTSLMVVMGSSVHSLDWRWWFALMVAGFIAWLALRRWLKPDRLPEPDKSV